MYVVFEGIDGCGKSSQRRQLEARLTRLGYVCVTLFEPSYGVAGRKIRGLISGDSAPSRETQLELFTRDRIEHVLEKVGPMLTFKKDHPDFVVLQERGYLSFPAYQGASLAECPELLAQHQRIAPKPDVFIYLDIDVPAAISRIAGRGDRQDAFETEQYLRGVLERYRWLALNADENIVQLMADQDEQDLAVDIFDAVKSYLPTR